MTTPIARTKKTEASQKETHMKAIIRTQFGSPDVLHLAEVEKPVPQDDEILVKVYASSINALDRHQLKSSPLLMRILIGNGLRKPKDQRLGADIAGRVEAVGANVTQFHPGDEVFGQATAGGFAEYACAPEKKVVLKPANLSFEAVSTIPVAALTALQSLRDKGQVQPGQKVLIDGASGGVGTFAVQIARSYGAEVTAVCSSKNVELVRSLGADQVIDYTREDATRKKQQYDLILAVNGYHSLFAYQRILRPGGMYILIGGPSAQTVLLAMLRTMLLGPLLSRTGGRKIGFLGVANVNQKDLNFVKELFEAGKVVPVIDTCYSLDKTAEGFRYLIDKHARGKVVITIDQNNNS
ncbi:MAG TPA: NAD(P)-dependent alcohol dehydrogenase [Ktedonobacteraceae bacterium]|nr:NAD(P)-dependent alcohol dehydrogenase [Ktedonobacteraceae bacterium]